MDIKVSVIITAYNIEKYIGECIESVQKQNFDGLEIIVVDDKSTDGTVDVVRRYMKDDNGIILFEHEENGGPARARNTGCRQAKGKYIYFLDGDDYIKKGMFEKLYRISEENGLDILSFSGEAFLDKDFSEWDSSKVSVDQYKRKAEYIGVYSGAELFAEYMKNDDNNGNLYLQFINRHFYVDNDLFAQPDLRYDNDSPFAIYMMAKRAMCIPDVFYYRRYRPCSRVTGKKTFEKAECIMLRMAIELRLWEGLELDDKLNVFIEKHFIIAQKSLGYMLRGVDEEDRNHAILNRHPAVKYMMDFFAMNKSAYPSLTKELMSEIKENHFPVIIYGVGMVAEDVADALEKNGIFDYSPVVTKVGQNSIFRNRKVLGVEDYDIDWKESIVLVATTAKFHNQIKKNLENKTIRKVVFI